MYVVNKSKTHKKLENLSKITETSFLKKGHLPSLLSPETDRILFRKLSNHIHKIILMIDDPVIDLPASFALLYRKIKRELEKIVVLIEKRHITGADFSHKKLN